MAERSSKTRKVVVRKAPSQTRSQEKVQAILKAARQLLATTGLEKLTTNHIASAAGMSVGSLYQYFPNKQAIIHQLYTGWLESIRELLQEYLAMDLESETPFSIIKAIMLRIYSPDDMDPDTMRYETELNKAMHLYPELQDIEHQHSRQIATMLAEIYHRTGIKADKNILFQLGLYSYHLYNSYEAMLLHEDTSPRQVFEWQVQGLNNILAPYYSDND